MDYLTYHIESAKIGDIDPANDMMLYISDRFELNEEQRYWIAFLFGTCYCGPTVYYIYNEFPDFETVDVNRLQRWWDREKSNLLFQTDRLRIKSNDQFVETFVSYRDLVRVRGSQAAVFAQFEGYEDAYRWGFMIRNFGRFSLFIYLEMVSVLTSRTLTPNRIDWQSADNCRKGLLRAFGLPSASPRELDEMLEHLIGRLKMAECEKSSIFNIETTLCAYAKFRKGKRYVGYYLDRQLEEINKMASRYTEDNYGISWRPLYDFRAEKLKNENTLFTPDGRLRIG